MSDRHRTLALFVVLLALLKCACHSTYNDHDFLTRSMFHGGYYGVLEGTGDNGGEYWMVIEEGGAEAGGSMKGCVARVWTPPVGPQEFVTTFFGSALPQSETEATVFITFGFGAVVDMTLHRVMPPPDPAGPGDVLELRSSNTFFAGSLVRDAGESVDTCAALALLIAQRRRDRMTGAASVQPNEMSRLAASRFLLSGGLAGPAASRGSASGKVSAHPDLPAVDTTPRDPRIFGTWCQSEPVKICRKVKVQLNLGLFKVPFGTRTVCADVTDTRTHLDYVDGPDDGLVTGFGSLRVDGKPNPFSVAGAVLRRGVVRLGAQIPGRPARAGIGGLSGDGLALSLYAAGEKFVLRKDACGNAPPQVTLTSLSGSSLAWGETHCFRGQVTQDEDAAFPPERMRFESSRDGALTGAAAHQPRETTLCTSDLSPGDHTITFTATDEGGLQASASTPVKVTNLPPGLPVIVEPREGDTIVATGKLLFEGKAFDPDQGALSGAQLRWSASHAGGKFEPLGVGNRLLAAFAEAGEYVVRLEASDGALSSTATVPVTVLPFQRNVPPRVTIEVPRLLEVPGRFGGSFPAGDVTFRGTASDEEDAFGDLALRWEATPVQPAGAPLPPVTGTTLAVFRMAAVGGNRTVYRVVFSATDRGGLVGKKVINVLITP